MKKFLPILVIIILAGYFYYKDAQYKRSAVHANHSYTSGDYVTALKEYKYLANHGAHEAYYNIGQLYYKGQGVDVDYGEALKWYRLGKQHGDVSAHYQIALMNMEGHGIQQDYKAAAEIFRTLSVMGHPEAQNGLGYLYTTGQGVETDKITAYAWFSVSSANGYDAAYNTKNELEHSFNENEKLEARRLARQLWGKPGIAK